MDDNPQQPQDPNPAPGGGFGVPPAGDDDQGAPDMPDLGGGEAGEGEAGEGEAPAGDEQQPVQ